MLTQKWDGTGNGIRTSPWKRERQPSKPIIATELEAVGRSGSRKRTMQRDTLPSEKREVVKPVDSLEVGYSQRRVINPLTGKSYIERVWTKLAADEAFAALEAQCEFSIAV